MPSSSTRWISLFLLSTALAAVALVAGALYYVLAMPSRSYRGALDFTPEERKLAERLRAHVAALAAGERNRDLDRPARYIAGEFGQFREQPFEVETDELDFVPVMSAALWPTLENQANRSVIQYRQIRV